MYRPRASQRGRDARRPLDRAGQRGDDASAPLQGSGDDPISDAARREIENQVFTQLGLEVSDE